MIISGHESTAGQGAQTVSSVSATSGTGTVGSFTKRAGKTGTGTGQYTAALADIEIWSAAYSGGALSAKVITVTYTGTIDDAIVQGAAITGTYGNGCSFDATAAASNQVTTNGLSPNLGSTSQTTTSADDLLIGVAGAAQTLQGSGGTLAGNTGFNFGDAPNGAGTNAMAMATSYYPVSAPQSGTMEALGFLTGSALSELTLVDALTSDAPGAGGSTTRNNRLMLMGAGQ